MITRRLFVYVPKELDFAEVCALFQCNRREQSLHATRHQHHDLSISVETKHLQMPSLNWLTSRTSLGEPLVYVLVLAQVPHDMGQS